jgi:hypothetical protein
MSITIFTGKILGRSEDPMERSGHDKSEPMQSRNSIARDFLEASSGKQPGNFVNRLAALDQL